MHLTRSLLTHSANPCTGKAPKLHWQITKPALAEHQTISNEQGALQRLCAALPVVHSQHLATCLLPIGIQGLLGILQSTAAVQYVLVHVRCIS